MAAGRRPAATSAAYSARAAATAAQEPTTLERRRPVMLGVVDDIAVECSASVRFEPPRRVGGRITRRDSEESG
jgi:hypothetical protein